jgi:hypothetical protein
MTRHILTAAIAFVSFAGAGRGDDKAPPKAPLPRAGSVEWDVAILEDSALLKVIKRDVKAGQVTWLMENRKNLPTGALYCIVADFLDEDGVKLVSVPVAVDPFLYNYQEGERNRLVLALPAEEKMKKVRKVVIKVN